MSWRNDPDYEKKMAEVIEANRRAERRDKIRRFILIPLFIAWIISAPAVTFYYILTNGISIPPAFNAPPIPSPQVPSWLSAIVVSMASILGAGAVANIWNLFTGRKDYKELAEKLDRVSIAMRAQADAINRLAEEIKADRQERGSSDQKGVRKELPESSPGSSQEAASSVPSQERSPSPQS